MIDRFARLFGPIGIAALLVVAGGSQALAAAPNRDDLSDSWCFDDTPGYVYCFEVTGNAEYVDAKPGSWVAVHQRVVTTIWQDGMMIGASVDLTNDRFMFGADGTTTYHTVTTTQSRLGDEQCHYQTVLRIDDFDLSIEHVNSSCGG
jgi:hypothetical protein